MLESRGEMCGGFLSESLDSKSMSDKFWKLERVACQELTDTDA